MIKLKVNPNRTLLRRVDEPITLNRDIIAANPVGEVVKILNQLPQINGAGHQSLEIVSMLTPDDMTKIIRGLKVTNPGVVDVMKKLGFWFPIEDKHHVRLAFACLIVVITASRVRRLHQL